MAEKTKSPIIAFELAKLVLPLDCVLPIRKVETSGSVLVRYRAIMKSIQEVGMIEPLMVYPQKGMKDHYLLMDGHLRLAACKQLGKETVECLVATDDESYIYNARVNRLAPIQQQRMILKAIENGVPVRRIAAALDLDESEIRARMNVTEGICQDAVDLLKDKQISSPSLKLLRKVQDTRQIEIAELLIAANNYSLPYLEALILGTSKDKFIEPKNTKPRKVRPHELRQMEVEMEALEREYKICEQSFAGNMLQLTLFRGFLKKLISNAKIDRFLKRRHAGLYQELVDIAASEAIC